MYTDFFHFTEKPFDLTASPRFLYLGEVHAEALALLKYGVSERQGFVVLTGEVGTGKTMMVQAFLNESHLDAHCVYISNPQLSVDEFISYLASKIFQKTVSFKSKADFLLTFEEFLNECSQKEKHFVLVIDEAHKLSFDLLEEIRLLSNIGNPERTLISIFLIAQPELNQKLSERKCRALLQRVSVRYHIEPLELESSQEYITTRLRAVGAEDVFEIIPKDIMTSIHHYSKGHPRLINILTDNALLLCYARRVRKLTQDLLDECYQDLQIHIAHQDKPQEEHRVLRMPQPDCPEAKTTWKWAAVLVFVLILASVFFAQNWGQLFHRFRASVPGNFASDTPVREDLQLPAEQEAFLKTRDGETQRMAQTVVVSEGDTVAELAEAIYGHLDDSILRMVQSANPHIEDINCVEVGQRIVFPRYSSNKNFSVHSAPKTSLRENNQVVIDDEQVNFPGQFEKMESAPIS